MAGKKSGRMLSARERVGRIKRPAMKKEIRFIREIFSCISYSFDPG
jgi:hypothetical protein